MTSQSLMGRAVLGGALAVLGAVAAFAGAGKAPAAAACPAGTSTSAAGPPADCCFANPAYTGTCVVSPGKDETCATILGYLNDPQSHGKSYCHNTNVRGGWSEVACSPAPTRSGRR